MKTLLFSLIASSAFTALSAQQLTVYYRLTGKDKAQATKLKSGAELPLDKIDAYTIVTPKEYDEAMDQMVKGELSSALDKFQAVQSTYEGFEQLAGNPSSLAAYYGSYCAAILGKWDVFSSLYTKANEKRIIDTKVNEHLALLDLWNDVANKKWERLPAKTKRLGRGKNSDSVQAELLYLQALSLEQEKEDQEAKEALLNSIALAKPSYSSIERLSILKFLELLNKSNTLGKKDSATFEALGKHYLTFYSKQPLPTKVQARLRNLGVDL